MSLDEGGLLRQLGAVPRLNRVRVGARRRGLNPAALHLEADAIGHSGEFAQSLAARLDTFSLKAKLNVSNERGQLTPPAGLLYEPSTPTSIRHATLGEYPGMSPERKSFLGVHSVPQQSPAEEPEEREARERKDAHRNC